MAYKQPKNTPMHNDGASEPITALVALGAKIGTALKGLVGGGKVLATTGKTIGTAGKTIGTTGKGLKGLTTVKGKGLIGAKSTAPTAKLAKVSAPTPPKATMKQKLFKAGDTIGDKYNMSLGKISKATGQDFDKLKGIADEKLKGAATGAVSKGVSKLQQSSELEEPRSGVKTTPLHGYSSPEGPNMFAHRQGPSMGVGVKYDNDGASQVPQKLKSTPQKQVNGGFASLSKGNIQLKNKGLPQYFLNNFSAPISIGGVQVDAGDIMRGLYTGGKMIQEKRLKNIEDRKVDAKNKSAQQKKQEQMTAKIMKDIDNPIDNIL